MFILQIIILLLMFIGYFGWFLMGHSSSFSSFFIIGMPTSIIIGLSDEMAYFNKKVVATVMTILLVLTWGLILYQPPSPRVNSTEFYGIAGLSTIFVIIVVALVFREWNKIIKATRPYDETLEINPEDIVSLNNKGVELVNLKRIRWAIEYFDKVLGLEPDDSAALHNKGVALTKQRKHRKAVEYFDKALNVDPGFENAKRKGELILET